ncbi:MAG: hypothetical protein WEA58_13885 [Balneolaceae bacterium]
MRVQTFKKFVFTALLFSTLVSCSSESEPDSQSHFYDIPITKINLISEFDQSGEHFFQHLNYKSIALPNGDVILNDREGEFIIQVDEDGEFIKQISRSGRGPGEVQDPLTVKLAGDSTLLIYDQTRKSIIRKTLDSSVVEEFSPTMRGNLRVIGASPTSDNSVLSLLWWDTSFLMMEDEESATIFKSYNVETDEILNRIEYPGETRARVFEGGRLVGATLVPFVGQLLHDHSPIDHQLYVFWSDDSEIAVLDPIELDTLRTIPISLPSERLTNTERDSLKNEIRSSDWDAVENMLPERKTPAEEMVIDHQNRIWLKLTLQSNGLC